MKTIILRLLQVVLLAVLVIIGVNVLEPLRPVKLSEEKQAAAEETVREIKESMKADSSSESGNTALENRSKDTAALENKERIACIRRLADGSEVPLSTSWVHSDYPDLAFADLGPDPVLPDPTDTVLEVRLKP